jgi:hypothetical protein
MLLLSWERTAVLLSAAEDPPVGSRQCCQSGACSSKGVSSDATHSCGIATEGGQHYYQSQKALPPTVFLAMLVREGGPLLL